ncbi:hypothetical protein FIV42_14650 [Persicimonas caeni]|uniref:Uncharacterized protein n=1 Tax=Persicimonas caeni TaxID=2292766 RepID=A0A4Y6PUD0_PERCE|nr:hypothetical protein [Persicimonas caeni]QDG51932.1 hypothetical protein FIV42_14650 [Persicimonas caeni]QED33153.1 hypothetical protein FRD00_14645 [Persicimonas caeni]
MTETSNDIQLNHKVEERILGSLKKRDGVATAGDVAADTGLGYDQTEMALRHMLTLYKSHLDVDDEGNLRYRFDPKFQRRGAQPGKAWRSFKQGLWKAFVAFFKVWTMVMLVGYTVLFVLLLVAVGIAGFAASMQSDDRDGGGQIGILPFLLVARFLEFMFWWNIFSGPRYDRGYGRGYGRRRGLFGGMGERERKKPSKPFYQKIFHYLFGPEEAKTDPLGPERAFAQFVRSRNGRITAAEWASRTGQTLQEAENALTASIVRFNGDVDVSDDGVLVYRFDELVVTAEEGDSYEDLPPIWQRKVSVPDFTSNKGSSNTWISVLNGFNLAMSAFILFAVIGLPLGAQIALGWVPFVFSTLFFAIPLLRKFSHNKRKQQAAVENERRDALSIVFQSARDGEARQVPDSSVPEKFQDGFLVGYDGDIEVTDDGITVFRFPRVAEELEAGEDARESAANEVVFGKTVFSSDEEEKSLDDAEMEEFDRRLSRELGGEVFEMEFEQAAPAEVSRS